MADSNSSKEKVGIYPGSFDPFTKAHVSIAERAARNLDRLLVAVAMNPSKKHEFSPEERLGLAAASIGHIANAEAIVLHDGLTVDHARELGARVMVRGARTVTDFLDEIKLNGQNVYVQAAAGIGPDHPDFVDTQTYYALPEENHIESSLVRGLIHMPGDFDRAEKIRPLVPDPVFEAIVPRLS